MLHTSFVVRKGGRAVKILSICFVMLLTIAGDNAAAVEVLQDLLADVQGQYELLKASLARVSS